MNDSSMVDAAAKLWCGRNMKKGEQAHVRSELWEQIVVPRDGRIFGHCPA